MPSFVIRKAKSQDALAIMECHRDAILVKASNFYNSDILKIWSVITDDILTKVEEEIKNESVIYLVAESNEMEIIGFALAIPSKHELRAVYSRPSPCARVGSALLNETIRLAKNKGCEYLEGDSSINAEKFYLKNGFRILSRGVHHMSGGHEMACFKMRIEL